MTVSIKKHFTHMPAQESIQHKRMFDALLADITAIRTSVTGITAQLDGDAGVSETTYASGNDPAALTVIS